MIKADILKFINVKRRNTVDILSLCDNKDSELYRISGFDIPKFELMQTSSINKQIEDMKEIFDKLLSLKKIEGNLFDAQGRNLQFYMDYYAGLRKTLARRELLKKKVGRKPKIKYYP